MTCSDLYLRERSLPAIGRMILSKEKLEGKALGTAKGNCE